MMTTKQETKFKETEIGLIPEGWELKTLGTICILHYGKGLTQTRRMTGKIPVYGSSGVTDYHGESLVQGPAIIIARKGSIGNVYYEEQAFWPIDTTYFVLNSETYHLKFLYYLIKTLRFETYDNSSAVPGLNRDDAYNTVVPIPPLPEQKSIAEILSSLDEKIELNRRMNKTLEEMGKALFKRWFVDFEFPNEEGKPYKSSGGAMVDSELGEIPEGWEVKPLKDFVENINGYSYKGSELLESSITALVTLKSFDRTGGFQVKGFKPFSGTPKLNQEVLVGDLVVAHTDLTQNAEVLGSPAFIFSNAGYKKMFITMDLVKITTKLPEASVGFFYYLMQMHSFKSHCLSYASGTTVLHLSKKAIPEYKIAIPKDKTLIKQFSNSIDVTTNEIINNISQIEKILDLKESILPKLISGKIRTEGALQ